MAASAPVLEPLSPVGSGTSSGVDQALEASLFQGAAKDVPSRLESFVSQHPESRWRAAIELNLGLYRYREGYFSRAIAHFEQAWNLAREGKSPEAKKIADAAAAHLCQLYSRLGRMEDLGPLLEEALARHPSGRAAQMLQQSREAFVLMNVKPGVSFRCGTLALARIREARGLLPSLHSVILEAQSPWRGFALAEVEAFARQMGMDYVAVKAPATLTEIPTPSVVHWKQNHYAAVIARQSDGRYLVRDLTFGFDGLISPQALAEEASGYFIVDAAQIPSGWARVDEETAWQVYGRGVTTGGPENATGPDDPGGPCPNPADPAPGPGSPNQSGMAQYTFHLAMASLHIGDIPIGYQPPVGPEIVFSVHYNERETVQPVTINFGNLGRQWGYNWSAWVEMPTTLKAKVVLPGGGAEEFTRASGTSAFVTPDPMSFATLTVTGSNSFRRDQSDGSQQIYSTVQNLGGGAYRTFLTQFIDRHGNTVSLAYDGSFRLITITDAIGQVTTLSYADPNDSYLVTKVEDPFGREATFAYNASGQLTSITDVEGIVSAFTYGTGDFLNSLTTPYGTTTFTSSVAGTQRLLTSTDPLGMKEKVEANLDLGGVVPANYPSGQTIPSTVLVGSGTVGFGTFNNYLYGRNSFYWDKKQYAAGFENRANATHYHWLHGQNIYVSSRSLEAVKRPMESWVFFNYPNQTSPGFEPTPFVATPSKTAQVVNIVSGTKQVALSETEVNAAGKPTRTVDPLGRETVYTYDSNNLDLIEAKQRNAGGGFDVLFTGTYNSEHLPLAVTGADGKTTTYTWNGEGQLTSVTNALSETTTYTYDGDGYLQSINPPLSGTADQITLTYDDFGRVETRTQWGYTLAYEYDNLDRITKVTYPDSTTEEVTYEALHAHWTKDRLNRWTRRDVNAIQQLVGVLNPAAEYTSFEWCKCGDLKAIIDAQGRATRWTHNAGGQKTSKIYADGRTDTYAYNPYSGWLETVTDDAGQQVKTEYALDGRPTATRYLNEGISTPDVTLTWDAKYPRVTAMVDGTGTTSYTYLTTGTTGAGRIATIDGPLGNDTLSVAYDELGRVTSRMIDGTGESITYDVLGRVATVVNPLDTFTMAYSGATGLPLTITGAKGLTVTNSYYGTSGDYRVEQTDYLWSGTQTLAGFDYQYDAAGRITRWDHQVGSGDPRRVVPGYDAVSRLINAVTTNPTTSAHIASEANRYDRVGNRLSRQAGADVTAGTYNNVNQLTTLTSGGEALLQGALDEPGTVTVGGRTTKTDGNNKFRLNVPVATGTNAMTVVSEDVNGNTSTNTATFTVANSGTHSFSYDLNGNTTSDGSKTYSWDGANRLVKITYSSTNNYTAFTYDGAGRRVRIQEVESGTTASDKRFVWDGLSISEQRAVDGTTVEKRYFGAGFQVSGTSATAEYFYVRDHLGSVRAVIDEIGVERGRWSYSLWGIRSANEIISGAVEADFGYTGHLNHERSGLVVAPFRFYDSATTRWISRDPIGEEGGINLYGYVSNDPVGRLDPLGLKDFSRKETQRILDEVASNAFGPFGMWNMYKKHKGEASYDFKNSGNTYCVKGRWMKGDEFGNYAAGYAAAYAGGVPALGTKFVPAYLLTRIAGVYYDADEGDAARRSGGSGNKFDFDMDSVPDIDRGYQDGRISLALKLIKKRLERKRAEK